MIFSGKWQKDRSWQLRYTLAVIVVVVPLLVGWVLTPLLGLIEPFLLFTLAVMFSAFYGGFGPGLLTTLLSCWVVNYFLVPPSHSLMINSPGEISRLGFFLVIGVQISFLSGRLLVSKRQSEAAAQHAQEIALSLERSEERLRLALQAANMGIWDWDIQTDCMTWSTQTEQLFGLAAGTFQGTYEAFLACVYPEDRQLVTQTVRRALEQKIGYEQEFRILRPDGTIHWIATKSQLFCNESSEAVRMLGTALDVSQKRTVEIALQQLNTSLERQIAERTAQLQQSLSFEATLKRITDKVRDSLDESQILQTVVQELGKGLGVNCCNTALYNLNQGTSEIYYEYNTSLFPMKGRVSRIVEFPEIYQTLLQGTHLQFCNLVFNPVRGRVTMLACPIFDDQGVLGDLWLITDKEYVFREPELRLVQQVANQCAIALRQAHLYQEAQAQVKALERLNWLKDDFLSTVSHELRTPVSNMKMSIRMLELSLSRMEKPEGSLQKAKQYLQILNNECDREISLINDLLDLQRLELGKRSITLETIQIQQWLPQVLQSFQERAQARQQILQIHLPDDELPSLVSDISALERILTELLNNACKYTPPGKIITVSAVNKPSAVQIAVCNTGVEIPASELPRIFDKFYRVPNADPWKQGGTGLGLALVQRLVEHLAGTVHVESTADQTTFSVEVPNHKEQI